MTNEVETLQVTDTEERADFARVAAMADDKAGGAVVASVPDPEQLKADAAESMAGLLSLMSAGGRMAGFNATADLWSPEKCGEFSALAVPVMRKYPWGLRVLDFFETGAGAEELALGAFVVPMALATVGAVRIDTAKPEADAVPAAAGPVKTRGEVETMREVHEIGNQ